MAKLFGKNYTKEELLDRIGDIWQVGGVRELRLAGGVCEGLEAVEFRTGAGFRFLAVPGRGLDITTAEFCGKSLAWLSASGEVTYALYDEYGLGWLRSFPGGLVTTCGLTSAGAPCEDQGEKLGIHGRYSNTPASNVWVDGEWRGDEYHMWAVGKVREARIFGENILLSRRVSAVLGENRFFIEDTVTNEGPRTTPHMILYHINAGYPVVDEGSELVTPTISAVPRDAEAENDKEHYHLMYAPIKGFKERCYYHDMATGPDGTVHAALINRNAPDGGQFGLYVKYNKTQLPQFTEWKMMGTREYVVGLEPANCRVEGRDKDRANGILQFLEPGETRKYELEIGALTTPAEVVAFEEKVKTLRG